MKKKELPDFCVTSQFHEYSGLIKVDDFKVKIDGKMEPRNLILYTAKYNKNICCSMEFKIPTYDSFYMFLCRVYRFNGWDFELSKNINCNPKFTKERILELVNNVIEKLSNRLPTSFDTLNVDFWYDGYKYAGYDKNMVSERELNRRLNC